jgi:hypothetical protein
MMFHPAAQRRIIADLLAMAAASPATEGSQQLPLQAVSSRNRLEGLDGAHGLDGLGREGEKKRVRFEDQSTEETESQSSVWSLDGTYFRPS